MDPIRFLLMLLATTSSDTEATTTISISLYAFASSLMYDKCDADRKASSDIIGLLYDIYITAATIIIIYHHIYHF